MPVPQPGGFEPARKLNPAHSLGAKHGEDGADMRLRAGQKVIVDNVAALPDRQLPQRPLAFRYAAEPAAVRAAPRSDGIARREVHAGGETVTSFASGGAADANRGDF